MKKKNNRADEEVEGSFFVGAKSSKYFSRLEWGGEEVSNLLTKNHISCFKQMNEKTGGPFTLVKVWDKLIMA